jgi:hypothetical protein
MFKPFFYRAICEIMWKNVVEPDSPHMTIWRMSIACCIHKATNTLSDYVTHCFSPATIVARTCLCVTLYVTHFSPGTVCLQKQIHGYYKHFLHESWSIKPLTLYYKHTSFSLRQCFQTFVSVDAAGWTTRQPKLGEKIFTAVERYVGTRTNLFAKVTIFKVAI